MVAAHFTFPQFIAGLKYQGGLGDLAVAVFFVLSGYVIAYVADKKEHTLREFAVSRLARIYSVAIPALILTVCVDLFLIHHGAAVRFHIPAYEYNKFWKYLALFLAFGSEWTGLHIPVFGDGVFWSLAYEVWYYAAFAAFFYLRGVPRVVVCTFILAIMGLPALLYFPLWLLGGYVYRLHKRIDVPKSLATFGVILSAIALVNLLVTDAYSSANAAVNGALNGWPAANLHNSTNFPAFYMAGLLMALNFFCAQYCGLGVLSSALARRTIAYSASFTFAIYLAHRPLMNIWSFAIGHDPRSVSSILLLASLVAIGCYLFGLISERRKDQWRDVFRRLLYISIKKKLASS